MKWIKTKDENLINVGYVSTIYKVDGMWGIKAKTIDNQTSWELASFRTKTYRDEIFAKVEKFITGNQDGLLDLTQLEQEGKAFILNRIGIEVLNLPPRAYNPLKGAGINTIGSLEGKDLFYVRNLGEKNVEIIQERLSEFLEKTEDELLEIVEGIK